MVFIELLCLSSLSSLQQLTTVLSHQRDYLKNFYFYLKLHSGCLATNASITYCVTFVL